MILSKDILANANDIQQMLDVVGVSSVDTLINQTVPQSIRLSGALNLPEALSEYASLAKLKDIGLKNQIFRSFIGTGYYDTITPAVIQRNILENPAGTLLILLINQKLPKGD